jgi:hypothetical protein
MMWEVPRGDQKVGCGHEAGEEDREDVHEEDRDHLERMEDYRGATTCILRDLLRQE